MAIHKQIKNLQASIKLLEQETGVNWIGKWAKSVKLNRMRRILEELQEEVKLRKSKK